jgi:hypothetical protein
MGSIFGGLKAGVVSGIVYIALLGVINIIALYIFKDEAIRLIQENYSAQCSGITAEGCFLAVVQVYLPVNMFVSFVLLLVYASIYGRLFEYIPGTSYTSKGVTVSLILLLTMSFFGSAVTQFTFFGRVIVLASAFVLTIMLGVLLGRFYRRYTRTVEFQSSHPEGLRIFVDRRDVTGKRLTFSLHSIHKARAEGKIPFKNWTFTGGVIVEDQRSFETPFEINGDGILKVNGRIES